jgi:(R,R)-butanediol dehydrogenase / meso-butanediol dehydrogenase / diacetyl reductase
MKAIVWHGPGRMTIEERPEPRDPAAGEVIVRPEAVGICGSEVEGYLGHMGNRTPPLVMGHEFAGVVVAAGDGAGAWDGARVAVNPLAGCGSCRLCTAGQENLCPRRTLIGIHHPGAFADLVAAPAANLRALPDGVTARAGALVEPLANGVHAVRLGLAGEAVRHAVVVGAGTIGLMTLQAALLSEIAHVGVVEPEAQRRERAVALGAHAAYGGGEAALAAVRAATDGLGADLVLDAVGAQATRALALELLRPGGQAVCIGLAADDTTLGFHGIVRGQLGLRGSYAYTMADFEQALAWLADGRVSVGELPAVQPLEDGPGAFARLAEGPPPAAVKVFLAGAGRDA